MQGEEIKKEYEAFIREKYQFENRDFSEIKVPYSQIIKDVSEWYLQKCSGQLNTAEGEE